jgi:hypothetical protein
MIPVAFAGKNKRGMNKVQNNYILMIGLTYGWMDGWMNESTELLLSFLNWVS